MTGTTVIEELILLFAAKTKLAGVYFPATPTGNENPAAPEGNIFLRPASEITPFRIIILFLSGIPAIEEFSPRVSR